jgi:hypothetical protein
MRPDDGGAALRIGVAVLVVGLAMARSRKQIACKRFAPGKNIPAFSAQA